MSLLNPDGSEETFGPAADDLISLETSLAEVEDSIVICSAAKYENIDCSQQIFVSDVELRNIDKTYNKMNLSNVSALYSDVSIIIVLFLVA